VIELEEARRRLADATVRGLGPAVVYRSKGGDKVEDGVITSVGDRWVFVRYRGSLSTSAATDSEDLEWLR
jgi:hypothetical protein